MVCGPHDPVTPTQAVCSVEDAVVTDNQSLKGMVSSGIIVHEQPDGSVIISLPPAFTEGVVNIPYYNGGALSTASAAENIVSSDGDDVTSVVEENDTEEMTDDESDVHVSRSRKRQRREDSWKQKIRVKKRNSGQSYIGSKGKLVPGKIRPSQSVCSCKNEYKCGSVSVCERQEIFDSFWSTANFDLQNATLCSLVDESPVARHTVRSNISGEERKRYKNLTREYHLVIPSGRKRVCKDMFLSTFGVSNGRLDRALKNRRANSGMIKPDQRGRHVKHRIPEEDRQFVEQHISLFPRYVSHYTRSHQTSREYLSPDLNLKTMY